MYCLVAMHLYPGALPWIQQKAVKVRCRCFNQLLNEDVCWTLSNKGLNKLKETKQTASSNSLAANAKEGQFHQDVCAVQNTHECLLLVTI